MANTPRQSDAAIDFAPDLVHGFAYCRELPPDVPPGMTLEQWRHAHYHGRRNHQRRGHRLHPRVRSDRHCRGRARRSPA